MCGGEILIKLQRYLQTLKPTFNVCLCTTVNSWMMSVMYYLPIVTNNHYNVLYPPRHFMMSVVYTGCDHSALVHSQRQRNLIWSWTTRQEVESYWPSWSWRYRKGVWIVWCPIWTTWWSLLVSHGLHVSRSCDLLIGLLVLNFVTYHCKKFFLIVI